MQAAIAFKGTVPTSFKAKQQDITLLTEEHEDIFCNLICQDIFHSFSSEIFTEALMTSLDDFEILTEFFKMSHDGSYFLHFNLLHNNPPNALTPEHRTTHLQFVGTFHRSNSQHLLSLAVKGILSEATPPGTVSRKHP